jgi:hypothetical protein
MESAGRRIAMHDMMLKVSVLVDPSRHVEVKQAEAEAVPAEGGDSGIAWPVEYIHREAHRQVLAVEGKEERGRKREREGGDLVAVVARWEGEEVTLAGRATTVQKASRSPSTWPVEWELVSTSTVRAVESLSWVGIEILWTEWKDMTRSTGLWLYLHHLSWLQRLNWIGGRAAVYSLADEEGQHPGEPRRHSHGLFDGRSTDSNTSLCTAA